VRYEPSTVTPIAITSFGPWNDQVAFAIGFQGTVGTTDQAWRANKRVRYIPFSLYDWYYAAKLAVMNGSSISGNIDLGIMDGAGSRVYHSGSTGHSGASIPQVVSPAMWLPPGGYYFAITMDNTTATIKGYSAANGTTPTKEAGLLEETTGSFGIPTSMTPGAVANAEIPWMSIYDDASLVW
jgi:hypothetical protein